MSKTQRKNKISPILFTGAGTGGHIVTAIAVIEALKEKYPDFYRKVLYIGSYPLYEGAKRSDLSLEEKLCKRFNIPFYKIHAGKLQRKFSIKSLLFLKDIPLSFLDAFFLVKRLKPEMVVSFGGYVSLPLVVAAKVFGKKVVIHEQTINIGLSNKIASYLADKILLTFKESLKYLNNRAKHKALVVGYPFRKTLTLIKTVSELEIYIKNTKIESLYDKNYLEQLKYIQTSQKPLILVLGGSMGSHLINTSILKIAKDLLKNYIVFLQTGNHPATNDYENAIQFKKSLPPTLQKNLILKDFIHDELGFLHYHTNLLISRSGAGAVYKAAIFKLPSIFIPIPWVTKNEQYYNAKKLQDLGLAKILPEEKLRKNPHILLKLINKMLKGNRKINQKKLIKEFPTNATDKIVEVIHRLRNSV